MSKRAPSDATISTSKRSRNQSGRDIAPGAKPQLEDYAPSVSSVSHDWLKYAGPDKLERLLVEAAKLSPAFDSMLNKAIAEDDIMLRGSGKVQDFVPDRTRFDFLLEHWVEPECWREMVDNLTEIKDQVKEESPLLTKLSALKVTVSVIE